MLKSKTVLLVCAGLCWGQLSYAFTCLFEKEPLPIRVEAADELIVAAVLKDEQLPSQMKVVKGVDKKVLAEVRRVFKGRIQPGEKIEIFYQKLWESGCSADSLASLSGAAERKSEFIFYIKRAGEKRFSSRGMGTIFAENSIGKEELAQIGVMDKRESSGFTDWLRSLFN